MRLVQHIRCLRTSRLSAKAVKLLLCAPTGRAARRGWAWGGRLLPCWPRIALGSVPVTRCQRSAINVRRFYYC